MSAAMIISGNSLPVNATSHTSHMMPCAKMRLQGRREKAKTETLSVSDDIVWEIVCKPIHDYLNGMELELGLSIRQYCYASDQECEGSGHFRRILLYILGNLTHSITLLTVIHNDN